METLLSFVPPTSCASCSWFFQATPKSYRDDPVFQSAAPGESPPLVEGPVPLNDVGPPAVPLGPPCATANVPASANVMANAIVVSFMVVSFAWIRKVNHKKR